ncbi:hypothetical protein K504DRAFT_95876 [Pleomassaria siparia CBS 279.74]|uniref:Uncharacterized protein n=1 Tax=Pleomassaria siparia CBS 279.74 TaxID=1314801 RepID=A0A6G1JYL4_9PLEO|nr:hypothetical protein K504DRAFT_95876 [Pleomassaria siparia CBS 279.74]
MFEFWPQHVIFPIFLALNIWAFGHFAFLLLCIWALGLSLLGLWAHLSSSTCFLRCLLPSFGLCWFPVRGMHNGVLDCVVHHGRPHTLQ